MGCRNTKVQAALRPAKTVRIGVDLCGVLLANGPARMLHNIRALQDVAQSLVAGALDWFDERVANCGSLSVFIINNVGSPKLAGCVQHIIMRCWRADGSNGRTL